ncbi:Glycos_transf_1 domain-containing protein [Rubrivivax sp. A210]|uniref:glycosyltransferase family 4 protein n=1 Tax=Rubrivivax sp. A210 TaxID=2772301 RepID=UPI001918061E|nr:glycosyltransferase family 4 protein [Rubrivivax sp. A210]CAD5371027.1 Glycos_transf_1 domain-containing protein [Rubrivivax sp. A210]
MSARPSIYYACTLPVRAGGELVNFQHVASLRKQGLRAFVLLDPASKVGVPSQPYSVPMVHWGEHVAFSPEDWLVVPEVMPPESFAQLAKLPCHVAIHNQNPFYTFRGFVDVASMNAYPLGGGLCCSQFTRDTLLRWGSTTDWQVVRPMVLPHFAQAARQATPLRQIACMPRKRPADAAALKTLFRGLYPEHAQVPWVEIHDMTRPQVAQALAQSRVFASLSRDEGLGLPPLEAMAAGCLVCGFDGGGGTEYATPENGYWVAEGDLEGFARALHTALTLEAGAVSARVAAAQATAAAFSEASFDRQLAAAWQHLLGRQAPAYRLAAVPDRCAA